MKEYLQKLKRKPRSPLGDLVKNVSIALLFIGGVVFSFYVYDQHTPWGEGRKQKVIDALSFTYDFRGNLLPYIQLAFTEASDLIDLYEFVEEQSEKADQQVTRLFQYYVDEAAEIESMYQRDESEGQIDSYALEMYINISRGLRELDRAADSHQLKVDYDLITSSGKRLKRSEQIIASLVFSRMHERLITLDRVFDPFAHGAGVGVSYKLFDGCEHHQWGLLDWFFNSYVDSGWKCVIDNYKALDHDHLKAVLALT